MVYTETRNLNKKNYFYRVLSVREGKKVSKKRVYLGCDLNSTLLVKKEQEADSRLLPKKKNKGIEKLRSKLTKILKKNNIRKAGIFGSYARGEQTKESDIDIAITINDKTMSLLGFIAIKQELEKALRKKVDLVEYPAIKPMIKEKILKEEIKII